jgi:hypothetical protein
MSSGTVALDPSVAVRRRHLPSEAGEENEAYLNAIPSPL